MAWNMPAQGLEMTGSLSTAKQKEEELTHSHSTGAKEGGLCEENRSVATHVYKPIHVQTHSSNICYSQILE